MKRIQVFIFFLLFLNPIMAEEGYYSLSYKMNSIDASIELNGVLQTEANKDGFKSGVATGLNLWIFPGENILKIKLLKPYIKSKNSTNPQISVHIRLGQRGQSTEEGKEIISFTAPESEGDKIHFPFEKEIKFTPEQIPPSNLWDKAEKIDLNDSTKKEILELVKTLHKAANTGNKKTFLKLNEFKMNDLSKAMYVSSEENKAQDEKGLEGFLKFLRGKLEKIPPKLSFTAVANGKLIYVTDLKGNDIIRTRESKEDGIFKIPVYVSKIEGKWILSR